METKGWRRMVMPPFLFLSFFCHLLHHSHSSNLFHKFSPHISSFISKEFQFRQFELNYFLIFSENSFHFKPSIFKLLSTFYFLLLLDVNRESRQRSREKRRLMLIIVVKDFLQTQRCLRNNVKKPSHKFGFFSPLGTCSFLGVGTS